MARENPPELAVPAEVPQESTNTMTDALVAEPQTFEETVPPSVIDSPPPPPMPDVPPPPPPSIYGPAPRVRPSRSVEAHDGFTGTKSEFVLVERLDDSGGKKGGQHPQTFAMPDLIAEYGAGIYRIRRFRNNTLIKESFERVPGTPKSTENGSGNIIEAMKTVSLIQKETEERVAHRLSQDKPDSVASTAVGVLGELAKGSKDGGNSIVSLMEIMKQEKAAAAEAHRQEMERLEHKHKLEMDRERERIKAEKEMHEKDLAAQLERERQYYGILQKVEKERQETFNGYYNRLVEQVQDSQAALEKQSEDRMKRMDEMEAIRMRHVQEMVDLKKSFSGKDVEIQKTQMLMQGLGKIGEKIHEAAIKVAETVRSGPKNGQNGGGDPSPTPPPPVILNPSDPRSIMEQPWFGELMDMVYEHVSSGTHGAYLGETFITRLNDDPVRYKSFWAAYLAPKKWPQVFADISDGIKPEYVTVFSSDQASKWYDEFHTYVKGAWEKSLKEAGLM